MTSDESLLQATGKGDLNAFDELVRRHQSWAWRLASRFLGQEDDAADVVQDSFIRLLEAADRYRPTASFKTYYHQIITRLCLDRAKKKKPLFIGTLPDTPDSRPGAVELLLAQEKAAAVRAALDELAPAQRMAIILRYYEELSHEDIGAAMQTTPKAVERLLARGRDHLRTLFSAQGNFFSH